MKTLTSKMTAGLGIILTVVTYAQADTLQGYWCGAETISLQIRKNSVIMPNRVVAADVGDHHVTFSYYENIADPKSWHYHDIVLAEEETAIDRITERENHTLSVYQRCDPLS